MPHKLSSNLGPDYLTGVERIDSQHSNLINLVNEARHTLNRDASPSRIEKIVKELLSYAIYHFRTEEALMKEYGYLQARSAEAQAHIQEHRGFSERVAALQEEVRLHARVDTDALVRFLLDWIAQHILETDKKLAAYILQRRAQ